MSDFYDDNEIARLLGVRKELPINWQARLRLRARQELPQTRSSLIVRTDDGEFRIMMRQSTLNPLDFSVILGVKRPRENRWFRLRRYNGLHPPLGEHRNRIERQRVRGFHVHTATLRYQQRGLDEDGFAVMNSAYDEVNRALELMLSECGFVKPTQTEPGDPNQGSFGFNRI